jgi:hypothetical protein
MHTSAGKIESRPDKIHTKAEIFQLWNFISICWRSDGTLSATAPLLFFLNDYSNTFRRTNMG